MLKGERREQKKEKAEAKVQRKSNIKSLTIGIRAREKRRQAILRRTFIQRGRIA